MHLLFLSFLSSLLFSLTSFHHPESGQLVIHIDNLRNQNGVVLVSLYKSEEGFPDEPKKAFKTATISAAEEDATVQFADLPYGTYAVALLHDEDENGEMETNLIGIPKEGYAFSNNVKGRMGPPDFEDAAIELKSQNEEIDVKMIY